MSQAEVERGPSTARAQRRIVVLPRSVTVGDFVIPSDAAVDRHDRWSALLLEEFFGPAYRDLPVYIDLEDSVLNRFAEELGEKGRGRECLLTTVTETLDTRWVHGGSLFAWHLARTAAWNASGREGAPPFLSLLGLFVVTAEDMSADGEFGANNYYGRLTKNLDLDHTDADARKRVERDYRNYGVQLWTVLNGWLRALDGAYGLPTAQAFGAHRFVTFPMSQALVRAHDRQKLPDLFIDAELPPGQIVPVEEMVDVLGQWMPSSDLSQPLKRMWESGQAAKERIAEVVAGELAVWSGIIDAPEFDAVDSRQLRLRIALAVESFPSPSVQLATLLDARTAPDGCYEPAEDTSQEVLDSLGACDGGLRVRRAGLDGWLVLDDDGLGCSEVILNGALTLVHDGRTAVRPASRLVVLERDEVNRLYVEAVRAHIGVDSVLLVYHSLWNKERHAITSVLREGWREAVDMPGVPSGWVLVLNVQVVGIPPELDDLETLTPLSTVHISFDGGLKLPGRSVWHADAPPEVIVSSLATDVFTVGINDDGNGVTVASLGPFSGTCVLSTDDWMAGEGDFTAIVKEGSTVRAHRGLSLRTSALPAIPSRRSWVGVSVGQDGGLELLGAGARDSEPSGVFCCGGIVYGGKVVPDDPAIPLPEPFRKPQLGSWPDSLPDEYRATQSVSPGIGIIAPCLLEGAHHWRFPRDDGRGSPFRSQSARCVRCKRVRVFNPKLKKKREESMAAHRASPPKVTPIRPSAEDVLPVELVLDALLYIGEGSWGAFSALAAHANPEAWYPAALARALFAAGYIDWVVDEDSGLPRSFAVPPAALVVPDEGLPFLTGRVDRRLRHALQGSPGACGADLVSDECELGVPIYRLQGLPHDLAEELCGLHEIVLSGNPGPRLATVLPDAGVLHRALPEVRFGSGNLQRFDYSKNAWQSVDEADPPGAYRLPGFGYRYAARLPDSPGGRGLACDAATAKYLGADTADSMVWYEAEERELVCRLGAPLFPTLERALLLDSGERPTKRVDGTYRYPGVTPQMARQAYRIVRGACEG